MITLTNHEAIQLEKALERAINMEEPQIPHRIIILYLDDWQIWYVDGIVHHAHHGMEDLDVLELARTLKDFSYTWVYPEDFLSRERIQELLFNVRERNSITTLLDALTPEEFLAFSSQVGKNIR